MKIKVIINEQPIPILCKGDLVISNSNAVVLVSHVVDSERFTGALIDPGSTGYGIGTFNADWITAHFRPFSGTITLSQ